MWKNKIQKKKIIEILLCFELVFFLSKKKNTQNKNNKNNKIITFECNFVWDNVFMQLHSFPTV